MLPAEMLPEEVPAQPTPHCVPAAADASFRHHLCPSPKLPRGPHKYQPPSKFLPCPPPLCLFFLPCIQSKVTLGISAIHLGQFYATHGFPDILEVAAWF
ncbi:hypothetical protein lerEdw1_005560 [Lerista edwardsae]|nr:hypothetical protein lerEdw1_005560 [Lerista edwardsae]